MAKCVQGCYAIYFTKNILFHVMTRTTYHKLSNRIHHASVLAVGSLVGLDSVVSIYKRFLIMGAV